MYGSYIVELRDTEQFFAGPAHPYGRGLLRALPENGLHEIPGHPPELTALRDECPFAPRCAEANAACWIRVPSAVGTAASNGSVQYEMVRCVLNAGS